MNRDIKDIKEQIMHRGAEVNKALRNFVDSFKGTMPASLLDAIWYPLNAGGKRLRPVLCLEAAQLAGGNIDKAMPAAIAIELVHTYSLVHDDLPCMDDDDLRRGQPTVHVKFGEAMAVLVGDALLTMAFESISASGIPDSAKSKVALELAQAAGPAGMIAGQVLDLEGESVHGGTLDDVIDIHLHKTAKLMMGAVRMGVLAAEGDDSLLKALTNWGRDAGLAFQIADDVLDETSTSAELGKSVGKDKEENKLTAVAVLGVEGARTHAAKMAEQAKAYLSGISGTGFFTGVTELFINRSS